MAPLASAVASGILSARETVSNISKRAQEYETWQIVLLALLPSLVAAGLVVYCVHLRIRLRRLYKEQKKTHPLLREREFAKLSKLTRERRQDNEELERSIMIQKSLASRTSFGSSSFGGEQPGRGSSISRNESRNFVGLTIQTDGGDQQQQSRYSFATADSSDRPRTAGSRGVPPSPLSQVMAFPFPETEQLHSPLLLIPVATSPRQQQQHKGFSMLEGQNEPTPRAVGSEESTAGSRRSSLPMRPSAALTSQPRPPSCVY
ncbi:hypothetical protein MN608_04178 [Microdochium nivale]|nr:hypothetical protein MN608_04178 [Microdochium nivale]